MAQMLIEAFLGIIKTGIDCYIIWVIGPDGTIFDLLSILKIIGSGITTLGLLINFGWRLSRKM